MSIGKLASGTFLAVMIAGLVLGLSLVLYGNGIAADYIDQGGGGLAVLIGWSIAGLGYLILAGVVIWAGITSMVTAIFYIERRNTTDKSEEGESADTGDGETGSAERAARSDDSPRP